MHKWAKQKYKKKYNKKIKPNEQREQIKNMNNQTWQTWTQQGVSENCHSGKGVTSVAC